MFGARRQGRRSEFRRRSRIARTMRGAAPALILLGLTCAGAGAAFTAVTPEASQESLAATPVSLVVSVEPSTPPVAPGVVRLPTDPLAGAGPIGADARLSSRDGKVDQPRL